MITDMSYESIQPYNMTQITFSWQLRPTISKNVQVYTRDVLWSMYQCMKKVSGLMGNLIIISAKYKFWQKSSNYSSMYNYVNNN